MSEQDLRKRFRNGVIICSIMGILILGIGITVFTLFNKSLNSIVYEQLKSESKDYQQRILQQISKDYESLKGLAVFLNDYSDENINTFSRKLYDAQKTNSFLSMAFFGYDGTGILVNTEHGIELNVDYHSLGTGVPEIIEAAYKGQSQVSPLFDSTISHQQAFAYSVPVYSEEGRNVIGVLAASNYIGMFEELLDNNRIQSGSDAIHLIDSSGKLLFSSTDPENTLELDSILYSSGFFNEETQKNIKHALENKDSIFCTMTYSKRNYLVYLHPVGINNWYIMSVNNPLGISHIAYGMIRTITIMFISLLVVVSALIIYAMRMNATNTQRLIQIAYRDPLTDADNLIRFTQNLIREQENGKPFSLVALNIHQFKFINEIMGTKNADDLLLYICSCICSMLGPDEFFCRDNGDLFYLFLRDTNKETLRPKIEQLISEIAGKSIAEHKDYKIRMYAGILICTDEESIKLSPELLITRTRFAMQYTKKLPSSDIHFYDASIHKKEEIKNYVETHMHQALENGEFKLFLQPKIDLKTGCLSGAEALVRWITAEGQMIFPDVFIPQFEENGFCIQLDMYMFEQACRLIRSWIDAGITPIPISVNQSKLLFFDKNYISNLETMIEKYQVPAHLFTLEILENLVLEHADTLNEKLRRLREIGFKISMDDFGSGYSSFNTLGNLEIDELKLDRAFLLEVSKEKGTRFKTIMSHIVDLTKCLNISTVAEGVETTENEELIQSIGCDYGQGYLYSRPVSSEEFCGKYMHA